MVRAVIIVSVRVYMCTQKGLHGGNHEWGGGGGGEGEHAYQQGCKSHPKAVVIK